MDKQNRGYKVSAETTERMLSASVGFGLRKARDYELRGETIYANSKLHEMRKTNPLADPDFFLSLAHCEPGSSAALAWTKSYGLLTSNNNLLGDPLAVADFHKEVDYARKAFEVYAHLRAGDADALRARTTRERISPPDGPPGRYAYALIDSTDARHIVNADGEIPDELVFSVGVRFLKETLEGKLAGLNYSLAYGTEGPLPLGGHALVPDWGIPDLLTAAWYQFSLIVADARPLHTCPYCGRRTPIYRSGKETCGRDRCKKANQRAKKRAR